MADSNGVDLLPGGAPRSDAPRDVRAGEEAPVVPAAAPVTPAETDSIALAPGLAPPNAAESTREPTAGGGSNSDWSRPGRGLLPEADEPPYLWLRRNDQLFVGVLLTAAFLLMAWHWIQLSGWGLQPVEISRLPESRYAYRLDMNQATWVEWAQLDGIGETLAQRIVDDRIQRGPFRTIDDLLRVKGIGPKKLEQIRSWLEVGVAPAPLQ